MELMRETILNLRGLIRTMRGKPVAVGAAKWSAGGTNNIVLNEDMGLELGNPRDESLACILWTEHLELINDGVFTLVGPDFSESAGQRLPFGKIVLAGVEGFNDENSYERYSELDLLRFDIDLRGFMLKAVSQRQREWCRISKEALRQGFSSGHVAAELMRLIRTKSYVRSVEVLFVTSTPEAVRALREIVNPAVRVVEAMNKMMAELECDCDECEYEDVCDEAEELRGMKRRAIEKSEAARGRSSDS